MCGYLVHQLHSINMVSSEGIRATRMNKIRMMVVVDFTILTKISRFHAAIEMYNAVGTHELKRKHNHFANL